MKKLILLTYIFIIAAWAIEPPESPCPDSENIAKGKTVQLNPAGSYPKTTDAADAAQLTDGEFAEAANMWYDLKAVGWVGKVQIEIIIDLGKIEPIHGTAVHTAFGSSGIEPLESLEVSVSDDGKNYFQAVDLIAHCEEIIAPAGYKRAWLVVDDLKTHGRYVKFTATGRGAGKYFFCDEIEIYRGRTKWLSIPLKDMVIKSPVLPSENKEADDSSETLRSSDSPYPDYPNIAQGKTAVFSPNPNYGSVTDSADSRQLTDGITIKTAVMWQDKNKGAVAWVKTSAPSITIDLGTPHPIRGAALHLGGGQAGVEWPEAVRMQVSDTGKKFYSVGDLREMSAVKPPETGYANIWLGTDSIETWGQYVKFIFTPKGAGAYTMLDEIEIYEGEKKWMKNPLVAENAPASWTAPLAEFVWTDNASSIPEKLRPAFLRLHNGSTVTGGEGVLQEARAEKNGVNFTMRGEAGKSRQMRWTAKLSKEISVARCPFAIITFQAEGSSRSILNRPLLLLRGASDTGSGNEVLLLDANMPLNDGKSHTVVRRIPDGFTVASIEVNLFSDDDQPRFMLERMEFTPEVPAVFTGEIHTGGKSSGYSPVNISKQYNGSLTDFFEKSLAAHTHIFDGARELKGGTVTVSGIPFTVPGDPKNVIIMPESVPSTNTVTFLRKQVMEKYLNPKSRNDHISIDVNLKTSEVYALLAVSAPPAESIAVAYAPLRLVDIECISVELMYDNGETEISFPYSIADKSCVVTSRFLAAFAAAADPSKNLKRVSIRSRYYRLNYALAGLTVLTSGKPVVPELATARRPEKTKINPEPSAKPLSVIQKGKSLIFSNRWFEYGFDLQKGFSISKVVNRWNESASLSLSPESGLRVRVGNDIYTGAYFNAKIVRTTKTEAEIRLTSDKKELPLELNVLIAAHESPELRFTVKAVNTGTEAFSFELCLPSFQSLTIGENKQTRMFFPQMRAVDTAGMVFLRTPYGPEFPAQFFSVYNPSSGTGLMLRTDNKAQMMLDYTLSKNQSGTSGGALIISDFNSLNPNESRTYPPVSFVVHNGGWHEALKLYKNWVHTWYKPYRSQDKEFFLNTFDINHYRTDKISWQDSKFPGFVTPDTKEFLISENFDYEKKVLGHVCDIMHLFNWNYSTRQEFGVYSTPYSYEQVGGLTHFRSNISQMQEKCKTPVSLYTIQDRFRISGVPDQELAKELMKGARAVAFDSEGGGTLRGGSEKDGMVYPLLGNAKWNDFTITDIVQLVKDTGCKALYLDVFAQHSRYRNYVPGVSPRDLDMMYLKRLKEELPSETVLWAEYSPTDFGMQYLDGAHNYYFCDTSYIFAHPYNTGDISEDLFAELPLNIMRFVIPKFKNVGMVSRHEAGFKPGVMDFVFINGDVFAENTWRLYESRIREKINRGYFIKHAYKDCFMSGNPEPCVTTEAQGITANLFPGKNRNLWTFFNGRPRTYKGAVIRVPHRQGAKYRDVWNNKDLAPVITDGIAVIVLTIDPQQPACVVQE